IGTPVSLLVAPDDADRACGETFTYRWSLLSAPGGSVAQIQAPEATQASFVPDVGGDYAIAVTIFYSSGTVVRAVNHLNVNPCGNNAPSIDSLSGSTTAPLVGEKVHVT